MKYDVIEKLKDNLCTPFVTVIGRSGAGVPIYRIETIVEYNNPVAKQIFKSGLENNRVVKTLLDETKIKSLIILDTGEIHPSTFHYITLKQRCAPYVTMVTIVGCDTCGINIDKINLIINYKFNHSMKVIDDLLAKYEVRLTYENTERTKSLILTDSKVIYPCTFNFSTIQRRIHTLRGDELIVESEDEEFDKYN